MANGGHVCQKCFSKYVSDTAQALVEGNPIQGLREWLEAEQELPLRKGYHDAKTAAYETLRKRLNGQPLSHRVFLEAMRKLTKKALQASPS